MVDLTSKVSANGKKSKRTREKKFQVNNVPNNQVRAKKKQKMSRSKKYQKNSESDSEKEEEENNDNMEYLDGENQFKEEKHDSNLVYSDDNFKLIDLYYSQHNILYSHQTGSMDQLMDQIIPNILQNSDNIIYEKIEKNTKYVHYLKFRDVEIKPPTIESEDDPMFPTDARQKNLTYSCKIYATVGQYMDTIDIATGDKDTRLIGKEERVQPANIPVMLRSKYCNLSHIPSHEKASHESPLDPGCYFIVNGNEKVIISVEKVADNKFLVFQKKDNSGSIYTCQVNSKSADKEKPSQNITITYQKNGKCMVKLPMFNEFPFYILLRALGMETDKEIMEYIVRNKNDFHMSVFLKNSMKRSVADSKEKVKTDKITTKDAAFDYLLTKLKYQKKYSDTDPVVQAKQKKLHLEKILEGLLPHINKKNARDKAFYFTCMANRLITCAMGRSKPDDRDSFFNKRVQLPGPLIEELVRQKYATLLSECGKHLKNKLRDDNEPASIVNQIKPTIIEQGIKKALSTGSWGTASKKGVAEVLQRLTFLQTLSFLRRLKSPTSDTSTNKLTGPRHLHCTQAFVCCVGETPEGQSTGMVKNLSLSCNVTISLPSQINIIRTIINNSGLLERIHLVEPNLLKLYSVVYLNGDPIGLVSKPGELYNVLRKARTDKKIDKQISISNNLRNKDIQIWTDGGRLTRPLLRVDENNELNLKQKHLESITLESEDFTDSNSVTKWNEFLMKYPDVIEYIDVEEMDTCMVAMYPEMVYENKRKMNIIPTSKDIKNANVNRYNMSYVEYSHCELHPSLMLGMVTSNTPICSHNHSPRIVYQYSQARQAMGIYATNYLDRMDLSYNLYYPERPLMVTKAMSYTRMIELPAGFNAVVAIATYGGYNMDDSIILNQSSVDRGFSRAVSYKKYSVELKKNAATSLDDQFGKGTLDDTAGMGDWNYSKTIDAGYVPKGTEVKLKDAVITKRTPVPQQGEKSKKFRDSSEIFKYNTPGVVDEVWANLKNADDYPMIKMRVRSRRIPQIADKFCSRMAQKGTAGILWAEEDMPWSVDSEITPDMIINPNAFPKRMTIAQMIELVAEKMAAIQGGTFVGTPFPYNYINTTSIFDYLKSQGFHEHGLETMYCGLTGKRFQAKIFVGPTYYLRLKHLVADKIHCLSTDHEVLTTKGWKHHTELTLEDKVASLRKGKLTYENPKKILYYPDYAGKLYKIKNKHIDSKTTINHRMYASKKDNGKWGDYEFLDAETIQGQPVKYKKNAMWKKSNYQFKLPGSQKSINMKYWLKFLGRCLSEDTELQYNEKLEIINTNNYISKKISMALHKLRFNYTMDSNKIIIDDLNLGNYLKSFCTNKTFPEWTWNLSETQSRIFLKAICISENNENLYTTSSEDFANNMMRLALHAGLSADVESKKNGKDFMGDSDLWYVMINDSNDSNEPQINEDPSDTKIEQTLENQKEPVFCLEIPSEVFYVRRNGKAMWTGNSRARGAVSSMVRRWP